MPQYDITSPDGSVYRVDGPDGSSEKDALSYVQQNHDKLKALPVQPTATSPGDTRSTADRIGTGMLDPIVGTAQAIAHVLPGASMVAEGVDRSIDMALGTPHHPVGSAGDIDQAVREREARIQSERGDRAGKMDWWRTAGSVAATLPLARGNPMAAGAIAGALEPVTNNDPSKPSSFLGEKAKQAGAGALFGKASEAVGNAAGKLVAPAERAISDVVKRARSVGYVLHPNMISDKPGIISSVLAGLSGKVKTFQAAAEKNQGVTNKLAATSLGIPEDTSITAAVLDKVRSEAGKAYQAIRGAIPEIKADQTYLDAVDKLGSKGGAAQQFFPKITKNQGIDDLVEELKSVPQFPSDAALDIVKELRFNANANLASRDDPSKAALGLAQRQAATEIDDLIERNLAQTGQQGLVDAYRQARQQIAKSYDIERSTNLVTGDVNALKLGALARAGKPLTGSLKQISDAAQAFPRALQDLSKVGGLETYSIFDVASGAVAAAHGHPGLVAGVIGRPLARAGLMTEPVQRMMATERGPPGPIREGIADTVRSLGYVSAPSAAIAGTEAAGIGQRRYPFAPSPDQSP